MARIIRRAKGFVERKARALSEALSPLEIPIDIERADYCEEDLRENSALLARFAGIRDLNVQSINWFVTYVGRGHGGVHTILRFMDYFSRTKGVQNRVILYKSPDMNPERVRSDMAAVFPELHKTEVIVPGNQQLDAIPACDAAVATFWTSAYQVLKFRKTTGKFYLIQDYEPLFYPAGFMNSLAEATYDFGFHAIVNSPGLWEFYQRRSSAPSTYFAPAVDREVFYPPAARVSDGKFRLFFYGRPGAARNAYELGMLAIRRLKQRWGDRLEIYVAGGNAQKRRHSNGPPDFINLGFLPYEKTGELYRSCDAGLVFMLTRHTSYIPIELMSCGAAVVSNLNEAGSWLYHHGENCLLSEPTVPAVVENVSKLISDSSLVKRLSANAVATVADLSWDREMDKVFDFMCRRGTQTVEAGREPSSRHTSNISAGVP